MPKATKAQLKSEYKQVFSTKRRKKLTEADMLARLDFAVNVERMCKERFGVSMDAVIASVHVWMK